MKQKKSALLFMKEVAGDKSINIILLAILQIVYGSLGIANALFMRDVIDSAVSGVMTGFQKAIVRYVSLVASQILLHVLIRYMDELTRTTYENRLKLRLLSGILKRDYKEVTEVHSGEWMNRMTSDTTVVAEGMTTILPGCLQMAVQMVGALCMIWWLQYQLAIIMVIGGILVLGLNFLFRKVLKSLHRKVQEQDGILRSSIQEFLSSLMVVKAFGKESVAEEKIAYETERHKALRMKRNYVSNVCNTGFSVAIYVLYILGMIYCGRGIVLGTVSFGTLTAVLQLIGQIQTPFAVIAGYVPKFYAMTASAERLQYVEAFDEDGMVQESAWNSEDSSQKVGSLSGNSTNRDYSIKMSHVDFAYQEEKVLSDFSMEITTGEFVALTGRSGCGKSTVLKLLLGLYQPQEGSVEPKCRSIYAYVPQGNYLMNDTIKGVVSFADQNGCNEEKLKASLKAACAEFVWELPEGTDTLLGERGAGLSEGQMQRIAIARALYADRPVLILDEATSALDEVTERKVLENIRGMQNKTVLIVTHRPAALEFCDRKIAFTEEL